MFEFGLHGGILLPSGSHNLFQAPFADQLEYQQLRRVAPDFGMRLGYYPIRWVGVEIENELIVHPKVEDVAVIGVPHPEFGEEVKAVVQPVAGVDADAALAEELMAYARERLAPFKCPRSVDFEDELPRLPTGKLYKRLLRDRYWGTTTSKIV